MLELLETVISVKSGSKMPLDLPDRCKYIPRIDPEMDPTSIRAFRELYFIARITS